jgi:hypothetical protein
MKNNIQPTKTNSCNDSEEELIILAPKNALSPNRFFHNEVYISMSGSTFKWKLNILLTPPPSLPKKKRKLFHGISSRKLLLDPSKLTGDTSAGNFMLTQIN